MAGGKRGPKPETGFNQRDLEIGIGRAFGYSSSEIGEKLQPSAVAWSVTKRLKVNGPFIGLVEAAVLKYKLHTETEIRERAIEDLRAEMQKLAAPALDNVESSIRNGADRSKREDSKWLLEQLNVKRMEVQQTGKILHGHVHVLSEDLADRVRAVLPSTVSLLEKARPLLPEGGQVDTTGSPVTETGAPAQ